MDKIKTIIIEENQLIQDSGTTVLTDQFIEIIPKDTVARYLKLNITFKNWIPKQPSDTTTIDEIVNDTRFPFVKINGELCPIMTQQDFEIKSEDKFQIESLMINNTVGLGNISMILVPNYMKNNI